MNNRVAHNLAEIAPGTLFVGIDVGKKKHQVSIMAEHARVAARFRIDSSRGGFEYLLEVLFWDGPGLVLPDAPSGLYRFE